MICADGVFILADKRVNDILIAKHSAGKIYEIDAHMVASSAGIVSDARVLIERAQVLAQQHRVTYDSPIEPELIIKDISNVQQQFSQYGGARPFGVSMMIAGINNKKPELYTSDVTGNYLAYNANAIGEYDEKIKTKLRELYKKDLTLKKGVKLALEIYKEVQGEKFDIKRFEVDFIKSDEGKLKKVEGREILDF